MLEDVFNEARHAVKIMRLTHEFVAATERLEKREDEYYRQASAEVAEDVAEISRSMLCQHLGMAALEELGGWPPGYTFEDRAIAWLYVIAAVEPTDEPPIIRRAVEEIRASHQ